MGRSTPLSSREEGRGGRKGRDAQAKRKAASPGKVTELRPRSRGRGQLTAGPGDGQRAALALADVARRLAATLDVAQATDMVVSTVLGLFGVRISALYQLDPVSGALTCVAAAGEGHTEKWVGLSLAPGEGIAGRVVATQRVMWSADQFSDPDVQLSDAIRDEFQRREYGSVAGAPLIARGRTLGALLVRDRAGRVFAEGDLLLLAAFASQGAVALENARLFEQTQRALRETETLLGVSEAVGSTLDLTEILRRVARRAALALGADTAGTYLADPRQEALYPVAGYHVPTHLLDSFLKVPIPLKGHRFLEEAWSQQLAVLSMIARSSRASPTGRSSSSR